MNFSLNFLNKYIYLEDFFNKPQELSNLLSQAGFEVEKWEDISKKFQCLQIAEVKEIKNHPSADRLRLCQVQADSQVYSIVCGADNFHVGDKVVLALPGAVLPGGLKIQARKIREQISYGMLLSLSELGFSSYDGQEDGIIVLPKDSPAGQDFAEFIGLKDIIFDLSITPNRADALSHFGLARELSCLLNKPLQSSPEKMFSKKQIFSTESIKSRLGLEIKQKDLCFRYTGQAVFGLRVQNSPLWLKLGLEKLGLKSINNVVDALNYLTVQTGQPLHAFDLDRLSGKITVDFPQKGEIFKTLEDNEISLTGRELCIRDSRRALALAGVIGGRESGIHAGTKNIFLESACFDSSHIRFVSKAWQIETEAGYRFSRGVPMDKTADVLQRAAGLVQSLAGGKISKDCYDEQTKAFSRTSITIHKQDIEQRLGMSVEDQKMKNCLLRLGCELEEKSKGGSFQAVIPSYRMDLHIKEDLIEEYARLEGYNEIPEGDHLIPVMPPQALSGKSSAKLSEQSYYREIQLARILVSEGFYQTIHSSFISREFSKFFIEGIKKDSAAVSSKTVGVEDKKKADNKESIAHFESSIFKYLGGNTQHWPSTAVQNPLSAEYNMMRVSLAPSLFQTAVHNLKQSLSYGRLFELGRVFSREDNSYQEYPRLGLIAWGQKDKRHKEQKGGDLCIYSLKSAVSCLLDLLQVEDYEWRQKFSDAPAFLHPGQFMVLFIQGQSQGYAGTLHSACLQRNKIRCDMAFAEINAEKLLERSMKKRAFKKFSYMPLVERDISLWIPEGLPAGDLMKELKKLAGPLCQKAQIFDVYEEKKPDSAEKRRSAAFRLYFQSQDKTMTEQDLKGLQDKMLSGLKMKWPVKLKIKE